MRAKEILSLVAILVVGLIVLIIAKDKNLGLRLTKVENTLGDILDNSDQTKLALGYMIQEQGSIEAQSEKVQPIGFKLDSNNS